MAQSEWLNLDPFCEHGCSRLLSLITINAPLQLADDKHAELLQSRRMHALIWSVRPCKKKLKRAHSSIVVARGLCFGLRQCN